jgi:hypothetical protein
MWGVPLEVFDHVDRAVIVSDERGIVRGFNLAAATLLNCDQALAIGSPCWKIGRFRSPDGGLICRIDCPVRRQIRRGESPGSRLVQHHCADRITH